MLILSDTPDHRRSVNSVLQAAADYHMLVEGAPPTEAHVDEFFTSVPDGYTAADLFPLGFRVADKLIGVASILRRWNAPNKAIIGLLVFDPQWRGRGYGRVAVEHIEALAQTWPAIDQLRIAVVRTNSDVLGFWRKVGFVETGEIKPKYGPYIDDIVILEKPLRFNLDSSVETKMIYSLGNKVPQLLGNNYVAPNASIIGDVILGVNANIWWNVVIRGDNDTITIGENVNIQDGSVLHTDEGVPLTLEKDVSVGHMAMLHGCTVKEGSLIGIKAVVLNRAIIGRDCLVGANSLIPEGKVIPDQSLVMGSPGRVIRQLSDDEVTKIRWIATHYVENAARYAKDLHQVG